MCIGIIERQQTVFLFAKNLESGVGVRKPEFKTMEGGDAGNLHHVGTWEKGVDGKDFTYSDSRIQSQSNRSKIYRREWKTRTRDKVSGIGKRSEQNCPRGQE